MGTPTFTIVLRGYDRRAVDRAIEQLRAAPGTLERTPNFTIVLRGYERTQVDTWFRNALAAARGSVASSGGTYRGMPGLATLRAVVLDCPDPKALAEFYRELLGGEIVYADDEWVKLQDGKDVRLAFQLSPDYLPPVWPSAERGQQFHIDVTIDDLATAEPQVLALGARKHEVQPGDDENWRVYLDPVGHPFCLCWD